MIIIAAWSSATKQNTYYSTKYVTALMPPLFLTLMSVELCVRTLELFSQKWKGAQLRSIQWYSWIEWTVYGFNHLRLSF